MWCKVNWTAIAEISYNINGTHVREIYMQDMAQTKVEERTSGDATEFSKKEKWQRPVLMMRDR